MSDPVECENCGVEVEENEEEWDVCEECRRVCLCHITEDCPVCGRMP